MFDGRHQSASVIQTDDPLDIASADKRHAGRDSELELPATTDVETDMTYATGHDARAVLAAKDIPILIANLRGPETLDELVPGIAARHAYVGFPSFTHVSGLNRKDCSGSN